MKLISTILLQNISPDSLKPLHNTNGWKMKEDARKKCSPIYLEKDCIFGGYLVSSSALRILSWLYQFPTPEFPINHSGLRSCYWFPTSILRPSTMVWWSSSLALSASAPLPKVTKPNPFDPRSLNMISTSNRVPYFYKEKKSKVISVSLKDLYLEIIMFKFLRRYSRCFICYSIESVCSDNFC